MKDLILHGVQGELRVARKDGRRRMSLPLISAKKPAALEVDNAKIFEIIPFP